MPGVILHHPPREEAAPGTGNTGPAKSGQPNWLNRKIGLRELAKPLGNRLVQIALSFALGAVGAFGAHRAMDRPREGNGVIDEGRPWPYGQQTCYAPNFNFDLHDLFAKPPPPGWFRWHRATADNGERSIACFVRTDSTGKREVYYSLRQLTGSGLFNRHYMIINDRLERASWDETYGRDFYTRKGDEE